MKEIYVTPEMEVVEFEAEDIIRTSNETDDDILSTEYQMLYGNN